MKTWPQSDLWCCIPVVFWLNHVTFILLHPQKKLYQHVKNRACLLSVSPPCMFFFYKLQTECRIYSYTLLYDFMFTIRLENPQNHKLHKYINILKINPAVQHTVCQRGSHAFFPCRLRQRWFKKSIKMGVVLQAGRPFFITEIPRVCKGLCPQKQYKYSYYKFHTALPHIPLIFSSLRCPIFSFASGLGYIKMV